MRILSISGQNIASLAQRFEIDFTAAPLAGAGLFAITGETGAGKSSILDAMCLALYGDAPRLAAGAAADEVPDASGDAIKARDSRAILRRGAAQGWAEVRFLARDGLEYIARWQARRARDKVDGRLQNVARSLARAEDGQVLASQTTLVSQQIEDLSGFSYEEFRRTVLLAQGDFDAFLRADTNDRAGLLEKVTGTGLYRAVSTRVYERTEGARQAHDALTQRRAGYRLLADEERGTLTEERQSLLSAGNEAAVQEKSVRDALDRHSRHAEAVRQLDAARRAEQLALDAHADAGADRDRLARIDRAAPLRPVWSALRQAEQRVQSAQAALAPATEAADAATTAARALQEAFAQADADHAAREAQFKEFGPLWDQASQLDAQILAAEDESGDAGIRATDLAQQAGTAAETLQQLLGQQDDSRAAQSRAGEHLASLGPALALTDRWERVQTDLTEHADASRALTAAQTATRQNEAEAERIARERDELIATITEDHRSETALTGQANAMAERIAQLDAGHPPARAAELSNLRGAVTEMALAGRDHATASGDHAAALLRAEQAAQLATQTQAGIVAATDAIRLAGERVAALTAPAEQADLAASDSARALRLRLEPGAPCPVCGSCDHPTHADAALAALAERLRSDLAEARQAQETARENLARMQRDHDSAQAQGEQAQTSATQAMSKISDAMERWHSARNRAQTIPGCPDLPDMPGEAAGPLTRILAGIDEKQETEQTAQAELSGLRCTLSELGRQREELRSTIATHTATRDAMSEALASAREKLALAGREAENAQGLVTRKAAALAPVLASLAEPAGALNDAGLGARLGALVADVISTRQAHDDAAGALATLAPRIAAAESRAQNAREQADDAKTAAENRLKRLEGLRAERAPLLGGEATAAHRTRINDARKQAFEAQKTAQQQAAEAQSKAATASERAEAARNEDARAAQALAATQAELGAALAPTGLMLSELAALFGVSDADLAGLRQSLRDLDDAVTSARAATASRQRDVQEALAAGLPEEPAGQLAEILAAFEAEAAARQQRIGAIDEEFRRDATTRQELSGLESQIAAARAELDIWQAVNLAVGSRSGDRFARVAQSITLDLLVEHANGHLADLNPRYCLRRAADLALQVEDRDMGGEPRATRSLSGGERFLVSLALALALSRMGGKGGLAATLFIDEGFGSLDAGSLDLAIDALESLQSQGRQVGVISHVEAMKERIPTRIAVRKQGGGKSVVEISGIAPAPAG